MLGRFTVSALVSFSHHQHEINNEETVLHVIDKEAGAAVGNRSVSRLKLRKRQSTDFHLNSAAVSFLFQPSQSTVSTSAVARRHI